MPDDEMRLDSTIRETLDRTWHYQSVFVDHEVWAGQVVAASSRKDLKTYIKLCGLDRVALSGKSFLDIGCMEGLISFWAEEQGALPVLAVDGFAHRFVLGPHLQDVPLAFHLARRLRRSKVMLLVQDVEALGFPESVGFVQERFDIVFFAGVLYHLLNPLRGLRNVYLVTREMAVVACPDWRPLQPDGRVFTPHQNATVKDPANVDYSNVLPYQHQNAHLWNLSPDDIEAMIRHAGFRDVERNELQVHDDVWQHVFYCRP